MAVFVVHHIPTYLSITILKKVDHIVVVGKNINATGRFEISINFKDLLTFIEFFSHQILH